MAVIAPLMNRLGTASTSTLATNSTVLAMVSVRRWWSMCAPTTMTLSTDDPVLAALIGELSMRSGDFRRLWAAHDVKRKSHGGMRLMHPLAGELTLRYETLALPGDQEQSLSMYHAEPGSTAEEALRLLASWGVDATSSVDSTRP